MTNRGFAIIFASSLLFLGQCGYSNGQCKRSQCETSGLGRNDFPERVPGADEGHCYNNGSKVSLSCKPGKFIDGSSNKNNTCNNGTWVNDEANCAGYCIFETKDHNLKSNQKQLVYNVNDTVAFSCANGYKLTSDSPTSFRCLSLNEGSWNDTAMPACAVFNCSTPNITDDIKLDPVAGDTNIYNGDQTITYSCPFGVTLDGSDINTCVDQDEWEFDHPTCMSSGNVIQAFWYLLTVTTTYTLLSFCM